MLSSLRHGIRLVCAALSYVMFALGALMAAAHALMLRLSTLPDHEKRLRVRRSISRLCRFYVNFLTTLGLIDYRIDSAAQARVNGHLVVANHPTLIDAVFCLALVENLCCIGKAGLWLNPLIGPVVRLAGYLPNSSPEIIGEAAKRLEQGENVLIFPEGTRNQHDLQLDFKRGASNIAVAAQCPILPIVIHCHPRGLGKQDGLRQLPREVLRISLKVEQPFTLAACVDARSRRTLQYRQMTAFLKDFYRTAISDLMASDSPHRVDASAALSQQQEARS